MADKGKDDAGGPGVSPEVVDEYASLVVAGLARLGVGVSIERADGPGGPVHLALAGDADGSGGSGTLLHSGLVLDTTPGAVLYAGAEEGSGVRKTLVAAAVAYVRACAQTVPEWESVGGSMHVRARDSGYFAMADLQALSFGAKPHQVMTRPLGTPTARALQAYMVYPASPDAADTAVSVTHTVRKAWGLDSGAVWDAALGSVPSAGPEQWRQAGGCEALYMACMDGADDNMAPLMDVGAWWGGLGLGGSPLVMLPHPSILLVTGTAEEEGIMAMLHMVASSLDDFGKRALVIAYEYHGAPQTGPQAKTHTGMLSGWLPWTPGPQLNPSVSVVYTALTVSYVKAMYDEQKVLLDRVFALEAPSAPPMVATQVLMRDPDNTRFFTYCVWAKGAEALLPKTDIIMFALPETFPLAIIGKALWDDVLDVVGADEFELTDFDPPRYRVLAAAFPTDAQLTRLCPDYKNNQRTAAGTRAGSSGSSGSASAGQQQ